MRTENQEERLLKYLNKFYNILCVFGAAPLPEPFSQRIPYASIHIIWMIVCFIAITIASIQLNENFHHHMPPIQRGLYSSEYITNILNVGLINIGIYYYRAYFHRLFLTLLNIDRKLWNIEAMEIGLQLHKNHYISSKQPQ